MALTRPTGEQLRFRSTKTGDHIVDIYLEAAEIGDRTLPDLLEDLFDPANSGKLRGDLFEFRVKTGTLQNRTGDYVDPELGWFTVTSFFNYRGAYANGVTYQHLDMVQAGDIVYLHISPVGASFTSQANFIASANTVALIDVPLIQSYRDDALAHKDAAAASASAASNSASTASTQATNASNSASTATTKAGEASASASSALTHANNASASATNASNNAGAAQTSANNAASSASAAQTSANTAATNAANPKIDNGSAAAPSLAGKTDTDTGIYLPNPDQVGITLGGVLQYRFANNELRTRPQTFEIGILNSGDRGAGIDLHCSDAVDYSGRIQRNSGVNGSMYIQQSGTGTLNLDGGSDLLRNANKIWHAGNDGAGSGLDADLLDGQHASAFLGVSAKAADADKLDGLEGSQFLRSDTSDTFNGNLTISASAPRINFVETDIARGGASGHRIVADGYNFRVDATDSSSVFHSREYEITQNTSGASTHAFYVNDTQKVNIGSDVNFYTKAFFQNVEVDPNGYALVFNTDGSDRDCVNFKKNNSTVATFAVKSDPEFRLTLQSGANFNIFNGHLTVGTTDPTPGSNDSNLGISLTDGGQYYAQREGVCMSLSRKGSNGDMIQFRRDGSYVSAISATATAVSYNTGSDERLKTDYEDIADPEAVIRSLIPRSFVWRSTGERDIGFIAHELQEHIPGAVTGTRGAVDAEGNMVPMQVDYSKIVTHLTAALQKALDKIEALEARVITLETGA